MAAKLFVTWLEDRDMSRVANAPVLIPKGVEVSLNAKRITVKGPKGVLEHSIHNAVEVNNEDQQLSFKPRKDATNGVALAGTTRALLNNMVTGVSTGFERKLNLVGVGYRAQVKGQILDLSLGFSHPVEFPIPEDITIETPSQTEILVKGIDKQRVGQTAAIIRRYRPPEPYKGKGVKYSDEHIVRKEAKKK
jgi:large subunit ribosomal protein L6